MNFVFAIKTIRLKYLQLMRNYIQIRCPFHFSCLTGYHFACRMENNIGSIKRTLFKSNQQCAKLKRYVNSVKCITTRHYGDL